jgi:uncharacterized membrane protein YeiH
VIIVVIQWIAIGVYAASGAMAAERARLDLFGAAVVGMTTALGGGVIRDVILGIHPPTVLKNWPFLVVAATSPTPTAVPRRPRSDRRLRSPRMRGPWRTGRCSCGSARPS